MRITVERKSLVIFFITSLVVTFIFEMTIGFSDDSNIVFLRFLACLIFVYCVNKGLSLKEKLNPYIYFSLVPLSLVLYTDEVSKVYLNKLNSSTWILALVHMVAYIVTLSYVTRGRKLEEISIEIDENEEVIEDWEEQSLVMHSIITFALGFFPYIYEAAIGSEFFLASVITFFKFPALALAWKSKNKKLLFVEYAIVLVSFMTDFNKSIYLSYALITVICYKRYFVFTRRQARNMVIFCVIGVLAFLFVAFPLKGLVQEQGSFSFDGLIESIFQYTNGTNDYYANTIVFNGPQVLRFPYMYFVSAWNNVQYVMETQSDLTYGLWFLKPLISWLQLDGLFAEAYTLEPYSSFNTFTYITVLYKDFGYYFSWIGSVFLGFYVGRFFNKYRSSYSAFDVAIYAVISQAAVEMFFSNHFFSLSYPFTIVVITWAYKLIFKSSRDL